MFLPATRQRQLAAVQPGGLATAPGGAQLAAPARAPAAGGLEGGERGAASGVQLQTRHLQQLPELPADAPQHGGAHARAQGAAGCEGRLESEPKEVKDSRSDVSKPPKKEFFRVL